MVIDDLVRNPGAWLGIRRDTGIVISSRVRLARNVRQWPFPGWASKEERVRLYQELRTAIGKTSLAGRALFLDMGRLDPLEKEILRERHLISNELRQKGTGSGVVIAEDECIAVMINEEDHLRFQAMSPGMRVLEVWRKIDAVDTELEGHVDYAFLPDLGYLTACPSNVGTGLRASMMMHLAGLSLTGEVDAVIKGLHRIGFEVRGLLGEGTDAAGNMFQLSNRTTLGESEADTVAALVRVGEEVVRHEQNARARLLEQRRVYVADHISRALAVLFSAHMLASEEAINLLSALRLGVDFGMVRRLAVTRINEILLLTQPAHLQKVYGKSLDPQERDEIRAHMVRRALRGVSVRGAARRRPRAALRICGSPDRAGA